MTDRSTANASEATPIGGVEKYPAQRDFLVLLTRLIARRHIETVPGPTWPGANRHLPTKTECLDNFPNKTKIGFVKDQKWT